MIVAEDLAVKEMLRNRRLSKQIADVGWSRFIYMLEYKTQWYGSKLIKAPRYYALNKALPLLCGYVEASIPLNVREWACRQCDVKHDRDVNAAINIWKRIPGVPREFTLVEIPLAGQATNLLVMNQ